MMLHQSCEHVRAYYVNTERSMLCYKLGLIEFRVGLNFADISFGPMTAYCFDLTISGF
jgi:hypothetical protein